MIVRDRLAAAVILLGAFLALGFAVTRLPLGVIDGTLPAFAGHAVGVALVFTRAGTFIYYVALAALTLLIGSQRRGWFGCALTIIVALLCAWFSSDLFKEFFARARPEHWYALRETSFSYASGHATLSLAFYGGWAYLLARGVAPSWWRTALIALLIVWVMAIGWSRLALGAHYPTDVLGGYLLGGAWLVLETIAIDRFLTRRATPT
jgi:undecaprenyl-diphosphatase